jgi:predicted PurR-regulated permease PerM
LRRRGLAVAVVTLIGLVLFIALAGLFGYPLVNGLTHLAHNLPKYVTQVRKGKGPVGHLARKYHIEQWVDKNLAPKLTSVAKNLGKPALTLGKGALSLLFALFVIFVLVILLLLEGPKLRRGVLGMMEAERAARVWRVSGEVSRSVTGFMLGNFITSIAAGVVVLVTLIVMGVPFALLWALWVALFDFLPMIGGAVAGLPTAVFALTHSVSAFIVFAVVFLAYTQVENHILNPIVMSRTVRINPLLVLIAILVGANVGDLVGGFFGGFVGTLLAIPLAGAIQVVVRELWQSTSVVSQLEVVGASREPSRVP